MLFLNAFASCLAISPAVVAAHGDVPGLPKIFGRRTDAILWRRNLHAAGSVYNRAVSGFHNLDKRQSTDICGSGVSCAAGLCCSDAGFCGKGKDFCASPDCQLQYGPACDGNKIPPGPSTLSIPRPRLGDVSYGGPGIYDCSVPGTVALSFDDGPYTYTSGILDLLAQYGAKATFFITGNNLGKGEIDNAAYPWVSVIKRMHADGHQIASHTWSHQDLSTLTQAQRRQQMYSNEMALRNILGFFPTYMRPPYSSCNAACENDLAALGYHITYFDLDTEDYLNDSPLQIQKSKNNFAGNLSSTTPPQGDWLVIGHDIHEQTAHNLTEYMLKALVAQGYKSVTVGDCLGDPASNWYRSSSGGTFTSSSAPSSSAPVPTAISFDGNCGGSTRLTCLGSSFGNCCSVNGWCGASPDYCGSGCQPQFGNCVSSNPSGSSPYTAPTPIAAKPTSFDGSCAGAAGRTCKNSTFGNCCSAHGWCGSTAEYCTNGCQSAFGTCR